jgi:hypothetical protein
LHWGPWKVLKSHRYAARSQLGPWKYWKPCNAALGHDRRWFRPKSSELADVPGRARSGKGRAPHRGSICVLGWGREALRGGGCWCRCMAATGAPVPAHGLAWPGKTQRLKLPWVLGKVFKRLGGCGCKRKMELGADDDNGVGSAR